MRLLVIRLSSIGDIILTTPLLRCLHQQCPDVHIDFLTKTAYVSLLTSNPHVEQVYNQCTSIKQLRDNHYDGVIDLQGNVTSRMICNKMHVKRTTYNKQDFQRLFLVLTKKDITDHRHVAVRYFDAVKHLNVVPDDLGLESYYVPSDITPLLKDKHHRSLPADLLEHPYVVVAVGAQHATKQIPIDKIQYLCANIKATIVLLGDSSDRDRIKNSAVDFTDNVVNLCGKTTLEQTQQIIDSATLVITGDTGLMHIAAALKVPTIVLWGCTVPAFGFAPYKVQFASVEEDLRCRPCHRFGCSKCPKGHYDCMLKHDWQKVAKTAQKFVKLS